VLFATLDPLVRQVNLPDRRRPLLISDTVGFIDRLPHTLVAAFRATLEEVAEADLLLHVIDAAHPERDRQTAAVRRVLEEVGAEDVPLVDVLNKCDLLDMVEHHRLRRCRPEAVCVSALKGTDRAELLERVTQDLALDIRRVTLKFSEASEGDRRQIARLYRHARVLRHVTENGHVSIEAEVPNRLFGHFEATEASSA
jgi:GTP-binding protein HflX